MDHKNELLPIIRYFLAYVWMYVAIWFPTFLCIISYYVNFLKQGFQASE